jgi:hypothetical protein
VDASCHGGEGGKGAVSGGDADARYGFAMPRWGRGKGAVFGGEGGKGAVFGGEGLGRGREWRRAAVTAREGLGRGGEACYAGMVKRTVDAHNRYICVGVSRPGGP